MWGVEPLLETFGGMSSDKAVRAYVPVENVSQENFPRELVTSFLLGEKDGKTKRWQESWRIMGV